MKLAQLVYVLKQYLIKKDIQEVNLSVKENQQLNLIKHEKTENTQKLRVHICSCA